MKPARLSAISLIASCALSACTNVSLTSQETRPAQRRGELSTAACPDVTRLQAAQLYGSWRVELPQAGLRGTLTLRQHPEFSASLRGEFVIGNQRSIASGDVEDGEFNLDESRDGKTLFAFWSGHLTPAACGDEIRGQWQPLAPEGQAAPPASDFVLRRDRAAGRR
jgi:hypothetical protein